MLVANSRRARLMGFVEPLERRRLLSITPAGIESQVNSFTTGNQTVPAVAMDASGNYVVAWQSNAQDGDGAGIFAQRFNASGMPQGPEFPVNTHTTSAQTSPAVAMDSDGDFVIAWQSAGQDGSDAGIYARRYDKTGASQGGEFRVNTYTTGRQRFPAMAMDAAGNFVIAWESFGQDGVGEGVIAQRYDASGAPQGSEFIVNTFTTTNQSAAAVAMDPAGNFVIAWHSSSQDGSGNSVHARRYDASGVAQDGEFLVNMFTTNSQQAPAVGIDADGSFVVAWESYEQDGDHFGIYARRYDSTGAAQGDEFLVNTTTGGAQRAPAIARGAGGDFIVTWQAADDSGAGVHLQGFFASGARNDIELRANTHTLSVQTAARVAMNADGDIVVTWQSFGQDGNGYGVYARRYRALGGVIAAAFQFDAAPHTLEFTFDADVSGSLGTDDIVVENITSATTISTDDLMLTYDSMSNTATFSYIGAGGVTAGALPDGNYRATLLAAGITSGGTPIPADYVLDFFYLTADVNHDRRVDVADLGILASNWQQSPRTFSQGNFDYSANGLVDVNDLGILASKWQAILPSGAPPPRRRDPSRLIEHVLG